MKYYSCYPLIFFLSILIINTVSYSQDKESSQPHMKMTLMFLPEQVACNPDGYNKNQDCKELTADDIDRWIRNTTYHSEEKGIPPGNIKLSNVLIDLLGDYFDDYKGNRPSPDLGRSIIMIFELDNIPRPATLRLIRSTDPFEKIDFECVKGDERGNSEVEWDTCDYNLKTDSRWIQHNGAHYFLPLQNKVWMFFVDNEPIWHISTD